MATAHTGKRIDTEKLVKDIEVVTEFSNVRFSPSLGLIKSNHEGKTLFIFNSGKIVIRKAKDEKDAMETIKIVSEALQSEAKES